jgi:uncharacterized protein (TIGR02284 family)
MSNPSATLLNLEETLRTVIVCLNDSQTGLRKIGEELQDPTLKLYFLDESLVRAAFRGNLEAILHYEGVRDIAKSESITAILNRVWAKLKAKIDGGDYSLLETAESDQHIANKVYTEALQQELPFPVRQTLISQAARIELFHDYILAVRQLKNSEAAS